MTLLLLTGLFGCHPDANPAIPMGGCLVARDDTQDEGMWAITSSGTVTDSGAGVPERCEDDWIFGAPSTEDAAWITWTDDTSGVSWTASAWLPAIAPPLVQPGEDVSVDFLYMARGWVMEPSHILIEDGGGALVAWVGTDGDVEDLAPPGDVTFKRGEPAWSSEEECHTTEGYDVVARDGGERVVVEWGGEETLGDLRVLHGGVEISEETGACTDSNFRSALMGLAPR